MIRISEFAPSLPPKFGDIPLCGGRVQSITVNPNNEQHIIVANEFGGLWKTENGGEKWFHLRSLSTVFAVDVMYAPDETIIATLARDNNVNNGGGIWISPDGGNNWSKPVTGIPPINPRIPDRISAYGISYAPDDANKVYVGTDFGVATSEDNGNSWSHTMVENSSVVQPDRMQNSVWSILALSNNKAIALSPTGVYMTNDGGRSWNNIRSGNFVSLSGGTRGFKTLDVSPQDSDKIFILESYHILLLYEVVDNKWKEIPLRAPLKDDKGNWRYSRGPFSSKK